MSPVVTHEDILAGLRDAAHWIDPETRLKTVSLTSKVGMDKCGVGVRFCKLEPGKQSCAVHYHLLEHEWIYILSGSATLLHVDASLPLLVPGVDGFQRISSGHTELKTEEVPLEPGDFAGWLGGARAAQYAHALRGGPEGCEYLCGGNRAERDVWSYPQQQTTLYAEDIYNNGFQAELPSLTPAKPRMNLPRSDTTRSLYDPVMTKEKIEEGLSPRQHPLDPEVKLQHARITDRIGWKMSGLAVHYVRLEPGRASSPLHYHLNEHEWVYILSGSAILTTMDTSLPELAFDKTVPGGLKKVSEGVRGDAERRKLAVGDFVGWQGGVMAAKHAHCISAGDEGCEYIMGGSRLNVDCCVFPLYGKAFVSDDDYGGEDAKFVKVPFFAHGAQIK